MNEPKKPVWPLVLMLIWYGVLLAGVGFAALIILSFGSEAYRGDAIPMAEFLPVLIPLVLLVIWILATVLLWNADKRNFSYALCAISVLPLFLFFFGFGLGL